MASCIVFPAVPLLKLKANCLHCWLLQAPTRSSFCSYSNIWDICQKYFLEKYFQFLNSSASGKLFLGCCQAHLIVSNLTWTALSKITLENSWQDSPLQICGVCWRVFFFCVMGRRWVYNISRRAAIWHSRPISRHEDPSHRKRQKFDNT